MKTRCRKTFKVNFNYGNSQSKIHKRIPNDLETRKRKIKEKEMEKERETMIRAAAMMMPVGIPPTSFGKQLVFEC